MPIPNSDQNEQDFGIHGNSGGNNSLLGAIPFVGSVLNFLGGIGQNQANRRFQREQYAQQRQDALEDWARNAAYNSPREQMRRLRNAGLNPHLVYGNGADATMNQMPRAASPTAPAVSQPSLNLGEALGQFMSTKRTDAEIDLARQNITNMQSARTLTEAQIMKTVAETKGLDFDRGQRERLKDTSAQVLEQTLKNMIDSQRNANDANLRANQLQPYEIRQKQLENKGKAQDIALDMGRYLREGKTVEQALKESTERIRILAKQVYGQELSNQEVQERIDNLHVDKNVKEWEWMIKKAEQGEFDPFEMLKGVILQLPPTGGPTRNPIGFRK